MPPLILDLRPSRSLIAFLIAFHALVAVALWVSDLPLALKGTLLLAAGLSLAFNALRYGYRRSRWFIEQVRGLEGKWILRCADGTERTAPLILSYSYPWLTILVFGWGRFTRLSVIVLPDSAERQAIRRLRVYLKCAPSLPVQEEDE